MDEKTNAMRIAERCKAKYVSHNYVNSGAVAGTEVADALGEEYARCFKTLVTVGKSNELFVFLVPVDKELDLKKGCKAVGQKSLAMLKSKDLLSSVGYIHGGCSPIGMKKQLVTVIDQSAAGFDTIMFSAGKIGYQFEMSLDELKKVIPFTLFDICV